MHSFTSIWKWIAYLTIRQLWPLSCVFQGPFWHLEGHRGDQCWLGMIHYTESYNWQLCLELSWQNLTAQLATMAYECWMFSELSLYQSNKVPIVSMQYLQLLKHVYLSFQIGYWKNLTNWVVDLHETTKHIVESHLCWKQWRNKIWVIRNVHNVFKQSRWQWRRSKRRFPNLHRKPWIYIDPNYSHAHLGYKM